MNYKSILQADLLAQIGAEIATLAAALSSATEAATHSESKAENKYDTRGLEASYLAGAQSERLAMLQNLHGRVSRLPLRAFGTDERVASMAVAELACGDERSHYWLLPFAGGYTLRSPGHSLQTVTLDTPLARALLGKEVGDEVVLGGGSTRRTYELVAIR